MNAASSTSASSAAPATAPTSDTLTLSLDEHNIGFFVPPGARLTSAKLECEYGVLIAGVFVGDINCASGSVIITRGGKVSGNITADAIYIEGELLPIRGGERIKAVGRQLIAASGHARINADLHAQTFSLDRVAKLWGQLVTIDGAAVPQG